MPDRWTGFIVTRVRGWHIFTPISDGSQPGPSPMDYWENTWEDAGAVGNYGVVFEPGHACRIIEDLIRAEFQVEYVDA